MLVCSKNRSKSRNGRRGLKEASESSKERGSHPLGTRLHKECLGRRGTAARRCSRTQFAPLQRQLKRPHLRQNSEKTSCLNAFKTFEQTFRYGFEEGTRKTFHSTLLSNLSCKLLATHTCALRTMSKMDSEHRQSKQRRVTLEDCNCGAFAGWTSPLEVSL